MLQIQTGHKLALHIDIVYYIYIHVTRQTTYFFVSNRT